MGRDGAHSKTERCEGCSHFLGADAVTCGPRQLPFCPTCCQTRPHCQTCEAPVGATLFLRGRSVCCRCFGDLVRCDACRREGCRELTASVHMEGYKVCPDCLDVRQGHCGRCGVWELLDPGGVCARCVNAPPPSDPIAEMTIEVRKFLEEAFGMGLRRSYLLHVVDGFPDNPPPPGCIVRGDFCLFMGYPRIRILRSLPEPIFMSVFAHEYTHAWQLENCPVQKRDLLEGFARWVQHKVLYELYEDRAAAILKEDDLEDYGPGLRACLEWEKRLGEAGLVRSVKAWTRFPALRPL